MSIIDRARELGQELAKTEEFQALGAARIKVDEHAAAKIMYEDFAKKQGELETIRSKGEQIPDNMMKALESSYQLMSMNPYIRDLLIAEYTFARLMNDVQKALGAEVGIQVPDLPTAGE